MHPPMYIENQRWSGKDIWMVSCLDYLLSENIPFTPGHVTNLLTSAFFEVCPKSPFQKKCALNEVMEVVLTS